MSSHRKRLLSTSVLRPIMSALILGVVALSASPSFAQDAVEDDDTIVVTGSRIRSRSSRGAPPFPVPLPCPSSLPMARPM